jgi:thiol:disulfide interchange protein DsbD
MLPMLPILSSVVFGTIDHHLLPRKKTIILALFYILGMACAFSLAGMATAWFGAGITASLQNRWVLLAFGGLMLILSAALLGFYELQMPHSWQSKVDKWIGKHEGGNIYGVFALGALSSLVASPCVSAPLAGVLTFIAQSGQVQLGGLILFVMACGMGVPLFLFAIGASRVVPRAGKWMLRVQRFFGVLMVLLALWVMLPAFQSFFKESKVDHQSKTINQQLYEIVTNNTDLEKKLSQAKESKQKTIVIISADWCVSCKELELQTLANEQVQSKLQDYKRIEVDITEMGPDQKALLNQYKIFGPPAILFFDINGTELKSKKTVGVISPQKLLLLL